MNLYLSVTRWLLSSVRIHTDSETFDRRDSFEKSCRTHTMAKFSPGMCGHSAESDGITIQLSDLVVLWFLKVES